MKKTLFSVLYQLNRRIERYKRIRNTEGDGKQFVLGKEKELICKSLKKLQRLMSKDSLLLLNDYIDTKPFAEIFP